MTGIILAGGESKRMGQDKSFLKVGEKTIIERTIVTLSKVFEDILIVTNSPDRYKSLGCRVCTDIIPGKNSLGGIYTGLEVAPTEHSFFAACDMPFLNESLIKYLARFIKDFDVVIPKPANAFEPLHAVYSKACIPYIKQQIEEDNLCVFDFFPFVKVKEIGDGELDLLDPEKTAFLNVNTKEDLQKAFYIKNNIYAENNI